MQTSEVIQCVPVSPDLPWLGLVTIGAYGLCIAAVGFTWIAWERRRNARAIVGHG